jgi:hypothetical protein
MPQLSAGAARVNITPYIGAFMAGFGGRDHGSEGVHDELHARAIVLQAGESTAGLVACDLIGLSEQSVAAVREHVERATGLAGDHVMVACTHTHSGPTVGILRHPGLDLELVHVTERKIAGAVIAAYRSMGEATLGCGTGRTRIGINRRERRADGSTVLGKNPGGTIDETVGVLRLDDAAGKPLAVAVTHPCHPVVLGGGNYIITADYPGQMAAFLETVYPGAVCPFLNGTGGNINPVPVGGTFEDARRLGTILGAEALQVAESIETRADVTVAVAQKVVAAPLAALPPADELRQRVEAREGLGADYLLGWVRDALAEYDKPQLETTKPLELQGLRLGPCLLISTPGETFVEIGMAVRAASPLPHTFVLGYTNGNVGYIQTASAFEEGGYEVESAYKFYYGPYCFAPGVEQAATAGAIELARSLATPAL